MDDRFAILSLSFIKGLGNRLIRQLIGHFGTPSKVIEASIKDLKSVPGVGESILLSIRTNRSRAIEFAAEEVEKLNQQKANYITYQDSEYPKRLLETYDFPVVLFQKGKIDHNPSKVLSIVGTRKATDYGIAIVHKLLRYLKTYNPLVVSGLAYGIDAESHRQALDNGLSTIGVMASGIDIVYPWSHKSLASEMLAKGGLVTEYPIGSDPEKQHFPARNRIIAGMADGVIVVEAARKGGALITAFMANDNNREVFAVPGNLHSKYSEGCNLLIRNHKANILTSPEDISYILNWEARQPKAMEIPFDQFSETEKTIVELLADQVSDLHIDEIMATTQMDHSRLSSALLQLELKGFVKNLPGNRYRILY